MSEIAILHQLQLLAPPLYGCRPTPIHYAIMERAQEKHARLLYGKLVSRIGAVIPDAEINVSGGGVQWRCFAKVAHRDSVINCFDQKGPEYLTTFRREGEEVATARTPSPDDTVEAIQHWLNGEALSSLYDCFAFVDQRKRELLSLRESIVKYAADLQNSSELQQRGSGICSLWFRSEARSVLIYFYGKNDHPDVICHWDECALFSFRAADWSVLGAVLKRWLCDNAMPSAMRNEFSWLTIGELADYYEKGNPIEGEFIASWDGIEQFYDGGHFPLKSRVLQFVGQLRSAGYDRKLRAGQSMWTFILSRSRRHGLRADHSRIEFQFSSGDDAMNVTVRNHAGEYTLTTAIYLSDQLKTALAQLVECSID
jgi:hypothetical protein